MAARGYPGNYVKGSEIVGLADAQGVEGVEIFHAGTRREGSRILANGGPGCSTSVRSARRWLQAQARAYAAVDKIKWPEGFCRRRHRVFGAVERERTTR